MSSRTYWLGNWSYHPTTPVPCISLLQIGLQMQCLWTGPLVGSKAIGSDPGLRITFVCFCTSPAQSLYMEAHKVSHASCCLKLVLNYFLKLKSKLSTRKSSLQLAFFAPQNVTLLGTQHQNFHLWAFALLTRTVWFDLTKLKQHTTNPETYNQFYLQLTTEYPTSENLFTD